MRKHYFFSLFLIAVILSCQSQWEKDKIKVTQVVKGYIEHESKKDSTRIDSINILKIDTLTAKLDSFSAYLSLSNIQTYLSEKISYYNKQTKSNIQIANGFRGYGDVSVWEDNFKEANKKAKGLLSLWDDIIKRSDNIRNLDSLGRIDSVNKNGYRVLLNFTGSKDFKEIKQDSIVLFISNSFNVIDRHKDVINQYREIIEKIED